MHQHDTALCRAVDQGAQGIRKTFDRHDRGRQRLDLGRLVQREQFRVTSRRQFGRLRPIVADLYAAYRDVLDQKVIDLNCWNSARGEADHDETAAPGQCTDRRLEEVAAEHVENNVGAAPVVRGVDLLAQVIL